MLKYGIIIILIRSGRWWCAFSLVVDESVMYSWIVHCFMNGKSYLSVFFYCGSAL